MKLQAGINFIRDWLRRDPEAFENHFRNLNNFIETKVLDLQQKEKEKKAQVRINYLQLQKDYKKMLEALIEQYQIDVDSYKEPYQQKLMGCLGEPKAFLVYKTDRVNVLRNKDGRFFGYSKAEEVYSKMKRAWDELEHKLQRQLSEFTQFQKERFGSNANEDTIGASSQPSHVEGRSINVSSKNGSPARIKSPKSQVSGNSKARLHVNSPMSDINT